jgi:hypothetical protein
MDDTLRSYEKYFEAKPKKNRVAFLDRDGILNVDKGYLYKIEDLEWVPRAKMAVELLCGLGYKVVVVTNQSGIARGYYTVADMEKLHAYMEQEIEKGGRQDQPFLLLSPSAGRQRAGICGGVQLPQTQAGYDPAGHQRF